MSTRHVVVVGGGITGLTVAHRLLARDKAGDIRVTVLEARSRLGGNVRTERVEGCLLDGGPDAWVAAKPQATALCRELGLGDRIIETVADNRRVFVLRGGELHALPEGMVLAVPTRALPLLRSRLLSFSGKARMALEPLIPRRRDAADESIGAFVRRRLGAEAVERIADPLLGGIFAGDVETLSIGATFPQLVEMERRHGSLVRGAVALMRSRGVRRGGAAPSAFHSLAGGVGELVDTLEASVLRSGGAIRRDVAVVRVAPTSPGFQLELAGENGALAADELVVTTPSHASAKLFAGLDPELADELGAIPYVSSATVLLAYARGDVAHPLDAVGVVVPHSEPRDLLAATFASSKWPGRAPPELALLRVFFGGRREPDVLDRSDAELGERAHAELVRLLGVRAPARFARVYRHERASAQPLLGHLERARRIRAHVARWPHLHLAGGAIDGVGIPDCVRQATDVAARIAGR